MVYSDRVVKLCALLDDKKAKDIVVISNFKKPNSVVDYYIIATGDSITHIRGIADYILQYSLLNKNEFEREVVKEGLGYTDWIVLDCDDVFVHIFTQEEREKYSLQKLLHENGNTVTYKKLLSIIRQQQEKQQQEKREKKQEKKESKKITKSKNVEKQKDKVEKDKNTK